MGKDVETQIRSLEEALRRKQISALKDAGESLAETAFLSDQPRLLESVVLAYGLAKCLEKPDALASPEWKPFVAEFLEKMADFRKTYSAEPEYAFQLLKVAVESLDAFARSMPRGQPTLVEKARVKAATQVYAHGASLQKAADFAGVSAPALAEYVGLTKIPEKYQTMPVKERLKLARDLFSN